MNQLALDLPAATEEVPTRQRTDTRRTTAPSGIEDGKDRPKSGRRPQQPPEVKIGTSSKEIRLPPSDANPLRTALAHLDGAKAHLTEQRVKRPANRRVDGVLELVNPPPTREVIDAACSCVALIPDDETELRSRYRVYTVVVDLLWTALTNERPTLHRQFAHLHELLSSRLFLDSLEDLVETAISSTSLSALVIPADKPHLAPLMRRLAIRARTLIERPCVPRQVRAPANDLVTICLNEARYSSWHAPTGLLGTATTLHPAEIKRYVPTILEDARHGDVGALICFVAFATAKMPRHFCEIGVGAGGPFTAFISENFSLFAWRGRVLHRSAPQPSPGHHLQTSDQFFAPLPLEVAELLRAKRGGKDARTLHDVCAGGEDLTRLASAYLNRFARGPRSVTLERLANSLPRLVAQCASDKTIGAAAYCDFTLANKAKLHYVIVRAAQVNAACGKAFSSASLSGALAANVSMDAAINPHLNDAAITKAIGELNQTIDSAYRSCGSRADWPRLRQVHATLGLAVAALVQLLSGVRPRKKFRIAQRSLFAESSILVVSDKKSSRYEARRLVALPSVVIEALQLYIDWLGRLSLSSEVPLGIRRAIASRLDEQSCASLFFSLEERRLKPLTGKRVAGALRMVGVERANEGRRVVERLAREGGASRTAVDTQLGHTPAGAETYCRSSALRPVDIVSQIKRAMDGRLADLKVGALRNARARAKDSVKEAA